MISKIIQYAAYLHCFYQMSHILLNNEHPLQFNLEYQTFIAFYIIIILIYENNFKLLNITNVISFIFINGKLSG